jgi:hypothetical protein
MPQELTPLGSELLITSLKAQRDELAKDKREMFALMGALIAAAGGEITLTAEALRKDYEIERFDNVASLTITFTAKETN